MPNVIVYLTEPRVHTFTGKVDQRITLKPGRNIVDADMLETVTDASGSLQSMIELQTVVVEGERVDVQKMDIKRAVTTIENEVDIAGVKELVEQEAKRKPPRKQVMDAAVAKLESLKQADEDAKAHRAKLKQKGQEAQAGAGAN